MRTPEVQRGLGPNNSLIYDLFSVNTITDYFLKNNKKRRR